MAAGADAAAGGPGVSGGWIQEPRPLQAVGEPDEGRVVGMDGTPSPCTVRKTSVFLVPPGAPVFPRP